MADIELVVKIPEDTYKNIIKNGFIYDEDNEVITHAIKNGIPHESVTEFADRCRECGKRYVKRQTGHWIRMKAYEKWLCSECNTVFRFTFKEHGYCPNCGAKMQEV